MKKLFILGLVSCISFLGFTSAVNVSCLEDGTCDPSNIYNFSDNDNSYIFNISCSADLVLEDDTEYNLTDGQIITLPGGTTAEFVGVEDCDFSYTLTSDNSGDNPGDDSGDDSGSGTGDSLLPGGEGSLSGIITGLNSTITEFIPYLVYLGLGIITVVIGFVAIRWLVNRTQAKIRGSFSSGRRRK